MQIKIGGVPEHFNYPFKKAIDNNVFANNGLDIIWQDCLSGTGQMLQMLENKDLDLVITLTEGTVMKCNQNPNLNIVQQYVSSSLCWGVHTGKENIESKITNPTFLISRLGSGSHLMAYLLADKLNINRSDIKFEIVNDLTGANKYLQTNPNAYFLWEIATTKPMTINGNMKLVDQINTPWPCFVIATRNDFSADYQSEINKILDLVFDQSKQIEGNTFSCHEIANYYQLNIEDVENWFSTLRWSKKGEIISKNTIDQVNQLISIL